MSSTTPKVTTDPIVPSARTIERAEAAGRRLVEATARLKKFTDNEVKWTEKMSL